jgi:branched-chain amino acid transport system permease protein
MGGTLVTILSNLNYVQILISGLALGAIYALIAQGYYITYNTTTTLNFAHGDLLMVGAMAGVTAYTGATLFQTFPVTGFAALVGGANLGAYALAIPIMLVVLALLGAGVYRLGIRPLREFTAIGWIMSTVGISAILRNVALLVWGANALSFPSPAGNQVQRFMGAGIFPQELVNFFVALVVVALLLVFLNRSTTGKAMNAVAFNRDAAALMGINVRRMVVLAYILAALVAGIGGMLVGPVFGTKVDMGVTIGLKAFAAAIIGGLVNPLGILAGGLLIGVVEQIALNVNPNLGDATIWTLAILILALRPQGLFGRAVIRKY